MKTNRYSELANRIRATVRKDPVRWARSCGIKLRPYQKQIALAIKDSIIHKKGLTFVVILPRQSGKNEVQRHLFGWLLLRAAEKGGTIVSVAPTFKPQTINAMERMRMTLNGNIVTRGTWHSSAGFIFRFHKARLQFFSGEQRSRVVGATADLLLSVDEAQDIEPSKFDKEFDPMTASSNATRVFWGTAWTSQTLLARQMRTACEEEQRDGIQRLFFFTGEDVAKLVPDYAEHLERVVKERGRQHPLVRTQYFNEEIDAQGGMFNAARVALMWGLSEDSGTGAGRMALMMSGISPTPSPSPFSKSKNGEGSGARAFLIDVAGMDEANQGYTEINKDGLGNPGRDSTTLSIVEIDLSTLPTLQAPTYRVVQREEWTGLRHTTIFGKLKAYAEQWKPQHIVIDATGVGEGLWSMLDRAFPTRVIPVKFTQQEKSEIGWRFLSIIETGRFRISDQPSTLSDQVRIQYDRCRSEILPGPAKTLRWGVPDGTRGPDGELVHDDHIMADALVAKLDELEWQIHSPTLIVPAKDPLESMSHFS